MFLAIAGYYRCFVWILQMYFMTVACHTSTDGPYRWTGQMGGAFWTFTEPIIRTPVYEVPDFGMFFDEEKHASSVAAGAVLDSRKKVTATLIQFSLRVELLSPQKNAAMRVKDRTLPLCWPSPFQSASFAVNAVYTVNLLRRIMFRIVKRGRARISCNMDWIFGAAHFFKFEAGEVKYVKQRMFCCQLKMVYVGRQRKIKESMLWWQWIWCPARFQPATWSKPCRILLSLFQGLRWFTNHKQSVSIFDD